MRKILVLSLILNTVYPGFVMAGHITGRNKVISKSNKIDKSSSSQNTSNGIAYEINDLKHSKGNLISNEGNFKKELIKGLDNKLLKAIDEVKNSCTGIKKDYDLIFGLNVASAVSSGVGTGLAAGALATGIMKAKKDVEIDEKEEALRALKSKTVGLSDDELKVKASEIIKVLQKERKEILDDLRDVVAKYGSAKELEQELKEDTKKSKKLGNIRTGLMAGATATSFASMGTSIASVVNIRKMAEKMGNCNQALYDLKVVKGQLMAEMDSEDENKPEVKAAHTNVEKTEKILSSCKQFDGEMLKKLHNQSAATATVSGVGGAVGLAGTITSALANSNKVRNDNTDKGKKKEKALNLMSNISAGVVTGTSAASTIISSISADVAKKESKKAGECEDTLSSI